MLEREFILFVKNGRYPAWAGMVLMIAGIFAFSGCGSGKPPVLQGEVLGKVTLDGKPLDSGIVRFHDQAQGTVASSPISGPAGDYRLSLGGRDTIPIGTYIVTVSPPPEPEIDAPRGSATPAPNPSSQTSKTVVPKKYQNERTTDLIAKVEQGKNNINLELKTK